MGKWVDLFIKRRKFSNWIFDICVCFLEIYVEKMGIVKER